jgi:hypothetical protein
MKPTDEQQAIGKEILDILNNHRGKVHRIPRPELLREPNLRLEEPHHDRFMRATIEYLRRHTEKGAWICSSLDGGYYLAETLDELRDYVLQEEGRAKKILAKTSRQRKVAGLPLSGQISLMGENG